MIKVQLLLQPSSRTPAGVAATKAIAAALGLRPTTSGAASVSAEVDPAQFTALFGIAAKDAKPAGPQDPRSAPLRIPEPLRGCVESITIAPAHIHFHSKPS